ncbi:MAG: hypothetical protein ACREXS_10225 [Gammaproteobacteria bacterium]
MKTLLRIQASIFCDGGQSSRLAARFVAQRQAATKSAAFSFSKPALTYTPSTHK